MSVEILKQPTSGTRGSEGLPWRKITAGVGVLLGVGVVLVAAMWVWMSRPAPAHLDLSTTQTTAQGLYQATIQPSLDPIRLNQLHTWTIHVETPDGQPVENAEILVDGDMPQHGHGLPTQPQVTRYLGDGDYLVEGMRFQMGGWWVVDFDIAANGQADTVRFNLLLQ